MYRGNMGDFVQKVSDYIKRNYDCIIHFTRVGSTGNSYYVAFFTPGQMGSLGYQVYDTENFEEQVYDFVNKNLEDYVQGEHDRFFDEPSDLFGEEL